MMTVLILIGCLAADVQAPEFTAANDEVRQYLLEAAKNNPGLKAKWLEWQASLQKVPQVTTLEDPMFMYSQFLQSDQYRFGLTLEQKFPWFGTLRARGEKATAESDAALSRFYAAYNEIIAGVKRAYFEYALLGESARIIQAQADTLTDVEELVKSRYALGLASQADLYRVQIEKDKLDDMSKGLEQSRPALSAKLEEALGRDAGEPLPWPETADFPPPPPPVPEVLARIHAANPDIAAMQHMVESWEKEIVLAKKRGYPEFTFGFGYVNMKDAAMSSTPTYTGSSLADLPGVAADTTMTDTPVMKASLPSLGSSTLGTGSSSSGTSSASNEVKDDIMVSLKVSVPVWRSRIKAGVLEARLMQQSAEQAKRKVALGLESAAHMALYNIQDAQRRFNLYTEVLIPKEKKAYENLQIYYGAGADPMASGGTADFMDIQNSVKSLLEFQLEQARAARDLHLAYAELEMLTGGPWSAAPNAQEAVVQDAASAR